MHKPINPKLAKYSKADKERLQKELIYLKMERPNQFRLAMIKLIETKLAVE